MSIFEQRKAKILQGLESDELDLSPKGKPDDQIIELLELLNAHESYVTTSSCSGRAVVYLDAGKSGHDENSRGRWLMNSHSLFVTSVESSSGVAIYKKLFGDFQVSESQASITSSPRFVTFKFEPLVIGIGSGG
jgi:tRNA wybutosine-synthesizing protein 3